MESPESSRPDPLTITTVSRHSRISQNSHHSSGSHHSNGSVADPNGAKINSPLLRTFSLKRNLISAHMISPANGAHLITPTSSSIRVLPSAPEARAVMQSLLEVDEVEMSELRPVQEVVEVVDVAVEIPMADVVSEIPMANDAANIVVYRSPSHAGVSSARPEPPNIMFRSPISSVSGERIVASRAHGSTVLSRIPPVPVTRRGISVTSGLLALPSPSIAPTISGIGSVVGAVVGSVLLDRTSPSRSRGSMSQSPRPRRPERVLAADDQKFVRDILERSLTQLGYVKIDVSHNIFK